MPPLHTLIAHCWRQHSNQRCLTTETTLHVSVCSLLCLFVLCAQGIDAVVGNIWESRNAGKLFKHMTIPEQE